MEKHVQDSDGKLCSSKGVELLMNEENNLDHNVKHKMNE